MAHEVPNAECMEGDTGRRIGDGGHGTLKARVVTQDTRHDSDTYPDGDTGCEARDLEHVARDMEYVARGGGGQWLCRPHSAASQAARGLRTRTVAASALSYLVGLIVRHVSGKSVQH